MQEHTPGPWALHPDKMEGLVMDSGGLIVAAASQVRPGWRANIRILGASLKMLEALEPADRPIMLLGMKGVIEMSVSDAVKAAIAEARVEK